MNFKEYANSLKLKTDEISLNEEYGSNKLNVDTIIDTSATAMRMILSRIVQAQSDEVAVFGSYLYYTFFEDFDGNDMSKYDFDIIDVIKMLSQVDESNYEDFIQELDNISRDHILYVDDFEFHDFENDVINGTDTESDQISEGVSSFMKTSNKNHKKKKAFTLSKQDLKILKAQYKRERILNRAKNRRYYQINKKKLALYQKSRNKNIKSGQHIVKIRKKV